MTSLELHLWHLSNDAWTNLLGVFTSDGLARLRRLCLYGRPCSGDDLYNLLSHTPALTSLLLCGLSQISSLSLFRQLPTLAVSLTQLTVDCTDSWRLTSADLRSFLALPQLQTLRLLNWPKEEPVRLTAWDRALFEQRPCIVLPKLEVFEWTTR